LGLLGTNWATTKIAFLSPIVARLPKLIAGLQGAESGFHPNEVAGALVWVLPAMLAVSVGLFFSPQHFVKTLPVSRKKPPQMNTDSHRPVRKYPRSSVFIRGSKTDAGGIASRWRWVLTAVLCLLATLFVGAVFLLTQSRSGYIGLALTLPLLVLPALPPRWRWVCLIVFVALAIALGFVVASRWEAIRAWLTGSDLASDPALSLNTLEGRLEIWSRAIYGIQDFPFTGMGMNAFRRVVSVLYPLFLVSPDSDIGHAHNEFLQAALDLGLPGLIAFLALYIIAFWMLADLWKRTSPSNLLTPNSLTPNSLAPNSLTPTSQPATINLQRAVILGLGGGLLAHLLYGLTDAVALGAKPGLLFWMLLGLIAGLHERAHVQNALPA
jgi:hypothetical protein